MDDGPASELDKVLLDSVDAALNVLGTTGKESVVGEIEKKYSIPWKEVPRRMWEFTEALRGLIGNSSRIVEKMVIARLVALKQISTASAAGRNLPDVVSIIRIYGPPGKQDSGSQEEIESDQSTSLPSQSV